MFVTIAMSGVPLFKTDVLLKTPGVRTFELSWSGCLLVVFATLCHVMLDVSCRPELCVLYMRV